MPSTVCSFLSRGSGEGGAELFFLASSDRMCGTGPQNLICGSISLLN